MKDILRRLARLEAKSASDAPAHHADHGLNPETYARAHADLTRLLSTHPTQWTPDEMEAMSAAFPQFGFRSATA